MWVNIAVGFGGVLLLGVIGFVVALREIRRDEARRRSRSIAGRPAPCSSVTVLSASRCLSNLLKVSHVYKAHCRRHPYTGECL